MGAGRGQVVSAARRRAGAPERCAVGSRDDLHVHTVLAVLLRVVRFIGGNAVGGDQGAVDDDEVALAQHGQGLAQAGRPRRENVEGLIDVAPRSGCGDTEAGRQGGKRLALAQVHQHKQGLLEASQLPPPRTAFTPWCVDEPGNVLDQLMRDVDRGTIRDQARLLGRCVARREHHRNDREPRLVAHPC